VQRQELFISYSQKDRTFLEQFWIHLSPLEEDYGLKRWDDSRIQPGDIWLKEIEQALERAQIALLLVSPDFLASAFIRRKELPTLFEAAEKDGLTILWLPIRPCSWKRHRQIEQYQSVGSLDPTLAEMDEVKRDREMVKITDRIHELFERIQNERQAAEAESLAQRQEAALRQAEQDAERQGEETARLERLRAESDAHAEAERWRTEAERLAREKEELQRQIQPPNIIAKQPSYKAPANDAQLLSLIQIPTTRTLLLREGNQWRHQEEAITVTGYMEELGDGVTIAMIQIPAGRLLIGSPDKEAERQCHEGPPRLMRLSSFFLGQTTVTQAQWKVVAGWPKQKRELNPDPSRFKGANRPVERVSWEDAIEFCLRLIQRTRRRYGLPSESQWEFACKAGTISPYAFGETLTTGLANYDGSFTYGSGPLGVYRGKSTDVASFPANAWGLHEMHGNVWEWCLDSYASSYNITPCDGSPLLMDGGVQRVLRGGSWATFPSFCRSSSRYRRRQGYSDHDVGFRVCCFTQD
jgi:formylglycine-generating enzyme required for sulfatase activity